MFIKYFYIFWTFFKNSIKVDKCTVDYYIKHECFLKHLIKFINFLLKMFADCLTK